jgi:hypothetical protein
VKALVAGFVLLAIAAGLASIGLGLPAVGTPASRPDGGADGGWDDSQVLAGLHPSVQDKIARLRSKMSGGGRRVYLMSGARTGNRAASLHNQALAVDVTVDDLMSPEVVQELLAVGFPCAVPYYARKGEPCHMAHADLRNTKLATGPYAPGGDKAKDCPGMALSRRSTCDNDKKGQWLYLRRK